MLKRFFPSLVIDSVADLPVETLKRQGIRALFFDIDNTLAPFDEAEPTEAILQLLTQWRAMGFAICLLSNNNAPRVKRFNHALGSIAVYRAGKPGTKKMRQVMAHLHVTPQQTALIGDQVFTDMYCANRAGVLAILCRPICNRDQLVTKVKRGAEAWVLRRYERSR